MKNYYADGVQVKPSEKLNVGFVRRGFSPSGGAEAYLRRVAGALVAAGHEATLFTTEDWPDKEWALGRIIRIPAKDPIAFADELERSDPPRHCDLVVSLERIWRCDFSVPATVSIGRGSIAEPGFKIRCKESDAGLIKNTTSFCGWKKPCSPRAGRDA